MEPRFAGFGTKTGGRRLLRAAGVAIPFGTEGDGDVDALADTIERLREWRPALHSVVVKLDVGSLGEGNAIVPLAELPASGAPGAVAATRARLDAVLDPGYRAALATQPWVVEELIPHARERSPSAQVRVEADGAVTVIATHDQRLGGPLGHTFVGARFPADARYATALAAAGERAGRALAAAGVSGRLAIDFVVAHTDEGGWVPLAVEINLREGATPHPFGTLELLTGGRYDAAAGEFRLPDGTARCYEATDRLATGAERGVDPETFLVALHASGLAFDPATGRGVVAHMLRPLGERGHVGVVAIGHTHDEAAASFARAGRLLERLGGCPGDASGV